MLVIVLEPIGSEELKVAALYFIQYSRRVGFTFSSNLAEPRFRDSPERGQPLGEEIVIQDRIFSRP
jgi:hypothetical protein